MKIKFLACVALLALAGCQTPAPQSVADSQRPPSNAVRREYVAETHCLRQAAEAVRPGGWVSENEEQRQG
ncbi:starvation-inducible outer membrane lipoprotein [Rhizobium leguminosarum]